MQLRSWTSTVTSTPASPDHDPLSRIDHTTNISSIFKGGKKNSTKVNHSFFNILKDHSWSKDEHPCSSLQPSPRPKQDHVLLQNYKLMCESKLHHVCYSQEKILQRFHFQLRQGKLQCQLIYRRSLTGIEKLSKPSSLLKCFPGSSPNKCSSSP